MDLYYGEYGWSKEVSIWPIMRNYKLKELDNERIE